MSTDYGFRCLTCEGVSRVYDRRYQSDFICDGLRHYHFPIKLAAIRSLLRSQIAYMASKHPFEWEYSGFSIQSGLYFRDWILVHGVHNLVVIDEYGEIYPDLLEQ